MIIIYRPDSLTRKLVACVYKRNESSTNCGVSEYTNGREPISNPSFLSPLQAAVKREAYNF